jgi:hypothetical protein
MTIAYTTGQITLTNGSAVVTGIGTAWQVSLIAGGFIAAEADGNPLPIETVDSDTSITAAIAWKGATGTYDYALVRDTAYLQQLNVNSNTLARLIAELDAGTIFKYDASGDLAGRATYDERPKGFSYLVFIGVDVPALYVKASATTGDWDGPFAYGTGPQGIPGPAGYVNPRGTYNPATAYARNDGVLFNKSSFVALQATTGNEPPTLPTTSNAFWQLTAEKGADGTGTGDVVGPSSSTNNRIALFSGATGKAIKDSGKLLSDLVSKVNGQSGDIFLGLPPMGRLTLTSGVPVMAASVAAATVLYYTPYAGNLVPIYDGANMSAVAFSELSQLTTDATKSPAAAAANSVYDIFVWNDAGTLRCTRGPAWTNSTTRGYSLVTINGVTLNAANITNGPQAQRGTWVGTIGTNATSTINHVFGAGASGGVAASLGVWNAYNRCMVATSVTDTGAGYTYSAGTARQARASAGNQIAYVQGSNDEGAVCTYSAAIQALASAGGNIGVGFNSSTAFYGPRQVFLTAAGGGMYLALSASVNVPGRAGINTVYAVEQGDGVNANTFNVTATGTLSTMVMM